MKLKTETKVFLWSILAIIVLVIAGLIQIAIEARAERETARANIERVRVRDAANLAKAIAAKPSKIAEALAVVDTDPEKGLKLLEWYQNDQDPIIRDAIAKLNASLKAKHIAKAREYVAANQPEAADKELLPYQGLDSTPDVQALTAKIADMITKKIEAEKRREVARRKSEGVRVGMTREQVIQSSWGKPEHINRTTTAGGDREQWVYPGFHNYLYFENGILTTIQH